MKFNVRNVENFMKLNVLKNLFYKENIEKPVQQNVQIADQ